MSVDSEEQMRFQFVELFMLVDDPTSPVLFNPIYREFGIRRLNTLEKSAAETFDAIGYCPVTGKQLPPSLRDTYFDEIEGLGFFAPDDKGLPQ
ncbi:DUF6980 family protein, partial [Escherichia coli]|uniref:DUF6980 family protein n=1 Tax=Escherichia coli TaxID=562 RepID=UPI001921042C